ncbi:MAG: SMI1/KNR4 family protein [Verrucomicrobiae bacterium]|nr:SMI1/KNR4 family protein [Verrucomicrobiae bacterium]
MTQRERDQILRAHWELPEGCRHAPATEEQISEFETEFSPIPEDYRWYLIACGGGVIGSEWIDGIAELPETHRKFQNDGYKIPDFFPIGWDGGGNPFGFDVSGGGLVCEDHDFGGIHKEADTFFGLLCAKGLITEG